MPGTGRTLGAGDPRTRPRDPSRSLPVVPHILPRSRTMKRWSPLLPLAAAVLFSLPPSLAPATDVDGPNDCLRDIHDYGDAPEAIPAYPSGVLGHFPTCVAPSAPGTQEIACTPPLSTP